MSAINRITSTDITGRWPHQIKLNGREYTMYPGGPSTSFQKNGVEALRIRVWNSTGRITDVTILETSKLEIITGISYWNGATPTAWNGGEH